ncbi:hypothetical protein H113_04486 [Trichophyton rubrum MR1459]|uniref:Uncharacterized protein n=1 Tax=Trichophyton rubrum (strain ATCC MYA-4607 / CBS 118892) TaxID=559305 RepID=A0A080WTK7_TRIRC|nr:uncharacterized protein TERG_12117 [Trichophyton rubrum CBS 118892]EZF95171.1 hypothetical protein H113_04486 [Trichophyton rubrum MR1459]EZG06074.1 hypothetical protein H106_04268 [Trichophyton rubrum CBS 735.88]KFL61503.1 hypothetical protein TERG_12117 [Trichophyton rubrum CBS 118892]
MYDRNRRENNSTRMVSPYNKVRLLEVCKFFVNFLEMVEEGLEHLHTETRVKATSSGSDTVHAQLRDSNINSSHTNSSTSHGSNSTTAAAIVSNLENLESAAALDGKTLEERSANALGSHMAVWISRNGDTVIQTRRVILKVSVEEVRVDSVSDVRGHEETVGNSLREDVGSIAFTAQGLGDSLHDAAHEIGICSTTKQAADFLVIKHANHLDNTRRHVIRGGKDCFMGTVAAQFVVDTASKDKILV